MVERIRSITVTIEVDTNKQTTRVTFRDPLTAVEWLVERGYVDTAGIGEPEHES